MQWSLYLITLSKAAIYIDKYTVIRRIECFRLDGFSTHERYSACCIFRISSGFPVISCNIGIIFSIFLTPHGVFDLIHHWSSFFIPSTLYCHVKTSCTWEVSTLSYWFSLWRVASKVHQMNQGFICIRRLKTYITMEFLSNHENFLHEISLQNSVCKMAAILFRPRCFNSLWPGDTMRRHIFWLAFARVMASCLTTTDHYPNQSVNNQ